MTIDWAQWGPPLAVFAIGAIVGLFWALRSRTEAPQATRIEAEGRRTDLEEQKAATLEALRALELEQGKLQPEVYAQERAALLEKGAEALRALDTGGPSEALLAALEAERERLGNARVDAALAALGVAPAGATSPAEPAPTPSVSPAWQGAAWALAAVVVVAGLVWYVTDSAVDRAPGASMTGNQDVGTSGSAATAAMPGAAEWEARLEADPNDIEALNALTEIAIGNEDLGTAMSMNTRARQVDPNDRDARVYFAFMKMTIGQNDAALELLDGVLAEHPGYIKALVYKGLIAMVADQPDVAVAALEEALAGEAKGNPFLEERLMAARRLAAERGMDVAPPAAPAAAPAGDTVVAGTATLSPSAAGALSGAEVLFVSVRDPAGGPPLAALRLPPGPFPLDFAVTTADAISMGGAPRRFPEVIDVTVRIDLDGNAMTRSDGEPIAFMKGVERGTVDLAADLR